MKLRVALAAVCICVGCTAFPLTCGAEGNRVTILYDAFSRLPAFTKDWGFSALVEYGGRRILFDTGNNAEIFAHNVQAASVDLSRLDFVVISHRHLDHTAGITHLLRVNPGVTIYHPKEPFGVFGGFLPGTFYRQDERLPPHMRYFDGQVQDRLISGSAWVGARFEPVDGNRELAPGFHAISLVSDKPGTRELRELSLAVQTAQGLLVIAGCSHPGIDKIVEAASAIDARLYLIMGGFHLPAAPNAEILELTGTLLDKFGVRRVAPGHCTGEPAFSRFQRTWGSDYLYAGVGTVIELP